MRKESGSFVRWARVWTRGITPRVALGLAGITLCGMVVWGRSEGWGSAAAALPGPDARRSVAWVGRTMGTYARVTLVTADSAAAAPQALLAHAALHRVDSLMTNWTTTSEVARLNREAAKSPTTVDPEVARVLEASLRIWRESGGAFDITVEPLVRAWGFLGGPRRVPSQAVVDSAMRHVGGQRIHYDAASRRLRYDDDGVRIDLGGIAKGYAVDVAADSLVAHGVADALVDLSGNMMALGHPPGADHWRIGIRDPRDRIPFLGRVRLSGQAISTSGQYEQFVAADGKTYGHIMDPRTGRPADGLLSVTVVAPTAMEADGWDTPLFVLGPSQGRRAAHRLGHVAAILVQPGRGDVDTVWVEESLRDRFTLEPTARLRFRVRYF